MHVTLRQASPSDVEWIAELRADVLRDDLSRLGRYDPSRVRQRFRDAFVADHTYVIEIDGEDSGSIAVRPESDALWIEHFYVPRSLQGKGIGRQVLASVLSSHDARPFRLNVLQGSAARRLYERSGFVLDHEDFVDVYMTLAPQSRVTSDSDPRDN